MDVLPLAGLMRFLSWFLVRFEDAHKELGVGTDFAVRCFNTTESPSIQSVSRHVTCLAANPQAFVGEVQTRAVLEDNIAMGPSFTSVVATKHMQQGH